jgi:hypothetical protein
VCLTKIPCSAHIVHLYVFLIILKTKSDSFCQLIGIYDHAGVCGIYDHAGVCLVRGILLLQSQFPRIRNSITLTVEIPVL